MWPLNKSDGLSSVILEILFSPDDHDITAEKNDRQSQNSKTAFFDHFSLKQNQSIHKGIRK